VVPSVSDYATSDWWREITARNPSGHASPRTLGELASSVAGERAVILLALSQPYALALRQDIALAEQTAPGQVALVSVGLAGSDDVAPPLCLLPVDARLKAKVGGAMQGVNGRIAELIVRENAAWFPNVENLHSLVRAWLKDAPDLPVFDRAVQTDDDVRRFIQTRANAGGAISKSASLRALRDSGRACEQARFGRLYREVMDVSASIAIPLVSSTGGDAP
jgi:hypothetical protein